MIGYIYEIKNAVTGKRYIGSTLNIEKRWDRHKADLKRNVHHNIYLQRSYNKYGEHIFTFQIIEQCTIHNEDEIRLIEQNYLNTNSVNSYNIGKGASGGDNRTNNPRNKEISIQTSLTIKKQRTLMTKQQRSVKFGRHKQNNGMHGKTHTDDIKKKLSAKGKLRQTKFIGKQRKGKTNIELFGKKKANEISEKISHYAKLRVKEKNPFYGKNHTDEFKQTQSKRRREEYAALSPEQKYKKKSKQMKIVEINGITYYGIGEAARTLGVTAGNICYHLKKKTIGYKYK